MKQVYSPFCNNLNGNDDKENILTTTSPNPAFNYFNVDYQNDDCDQCESEIVIRDMSGNLLLKKKIVEGISERVDVLELSGYKMPGIFFVTVAGKTTKVLLNHE